MVTEEGCSYLASALSENPTYLKELDLSYNHPGDTGANLLSDILKDPHCRLDTLSTYHHTQGELTVPALVHTPNRTITEGIAIQDPAGLAMAVDRGDCDEGHHEQLLQQIVQQLTQVT
ncbi:hypothetical protein NFI96_000945 [Prochilodus magdalenae]|nr:hypothetical protein NFI96_000945 [Prochilodus magdalenae]